MDNFGRIIKFFPLQPKRWGKRCGMKNLIWLSLVLSVSCSQLQSKQAVNFPFAPELVQKMQTDVKRAPASLMVSDVEGKSSRRVYFSALYHQYLAMGRYLNQTSSVKFCPQFHHDKVETDASVVPGMSLFQASAVTSNEQDFFPEVAFNEDFSLSDYYQEIGSEIATLCEEGVSDNYYKFDNLVTHYASSASFHKKPESMQAVLKIPVFANYYLLQMFQTSHVASLAHPEEKRVIELTRTQWFEKYVAEAQRLRNNFIKYKMVQR
jgi:hypothetical protein